MGTIQMSADAVGMSDVLKKLDQVGALERAAGPALRAGAQIVLTAAQARVPVRTGALKKGLRVGRRKNTPNTQAVEVGTFGTNRVSYAHLVERGHGGPHPAPAHPFLEPAANESAQAATEAILEALKKNL